jgi:hypothetical protein
MLQGTFFILQALNGLEKKTVPAIKRDILSTHYLLACTDLKLEWRL